MVLRDARQPVLTVSYWLLRVSDYLAGGFE